MNIRLWGGVVGVIVLLTILAPVVYAAVGTYGPPNSTPQPEISGDDRGYVEGELIVRFHPFLSDDLVKIREITGKVHAAIGGHVKWDLGKVGSSRIQLVKLPEGMSVEDAAAQYAKNPFVLYAEPNYKLHIAAVPDDPQYPDLWGMQTIDAPDAWDRQTGSQGVIVAVVDTGVDYNHPDLRDNIWVNTDEIPDNGVDDDNNGYIDDVHGWDFYNNDNNPMDDHGHGTHCAGTIGASGNNGLGVTGLAWQVKIMPLKFLSGEGYGTDAGATAAILYARENGATIVSNSYGGAGGSQSLRAAIEGSPALFVCAAGNNGADADTSPFYPAAYPSANIISVAATGQNDNLASFSNYGDVSVDLAAPGVGIWSTKPGGGYQSMSGTSMATPHVAGIAALVKAQNPGYSPAQIKSAILTGVDPVPALSGKVLTGGRASAANPLYATFFANTTSGPVPLYVQFSPVPDDASSWFWEFGDGGISSARNPVHVYQIAGTYSVSLSSTYGIASHTYSRPGSIVAGPVSMPDLIVATVDGPSGATPGQTIQISTTVKNVGTSAAGNGFSVRLYLSPDQTITASDTYLGERQVPSLAAGATSTALTSVVVPAQIALGQYYVGAEVDAGTQIAESVESNNSGYDPQPITISTVPPQGPDLVVSYIDAPVSGIAGKTVALTSLVKNEGTASPGAVTYVRFYLSADQAITTSDLYLGQRYISSTLSPGGTSTGTTTVTIPATVTAGTYYAGAIADATALVKESNENNNAAYDSTAIVISAAPKPDLVVTTVDSPSAGAAGGVIAITSKVSNIGTAGPGATSYLKFYLSSDQVITTNDLYLGQRYISSSLAPGSSSSGTTSVTIPATVSPGTYYAGAIADATAVVAESNENNNAACDAMAIVISAAPKPDLVISSLDAPVSGRRGSYLKITNTVKNQGMASSSSSYLKFYLSTDTVITTGDQYIGQRSVTSLSPGAVSTASSYIILSSTIAPGSYYIGAITDATNLVPESDENNNVAVDQTKIAIT